MYLRDLAVIWEVDESKRAVEEARKHEIAQWFFRFMKTVKWTKTTGGEVQYINENMEDAGQWDPAINDRHGWAQKVYEREMARMGVKLIGALLMSYTAYQRH